MAVSGVRSSCEATEAKSRADSSAALVRCCSSPMRASMPSTASEISTASHTPRTWTSSGLDCALIARAWAANRWNGLIMISHITPPTRKVPTMTPPHIGSPRSLTGGERADPVVDTVDRGVGVAVVELGQHDVAGHRHRLAVHAHGAHEAGVRRGLLRTGPHG